MIQKLENTFLAILRAGVILIAIVMIAATVFFGVSALPALGISGAVKQEATAVSASDVIGLMLPKKEVLITQEAMSARADPEPVKPVVVYQADVEKIAASISKFVTANGGTPAPNDVIASLIHDHIDVFDADALKVAYAKGLAGSIDAIFANGEVSRKAKSDVVATVQAVLKSHHEAFVKKAMEAEKATEKAERESAKKKSDAEMALYVTGAALFAFLIAACLLVIVRIERNTRAA